MLEYSKPAAERVHLLRRTANELDKTVELPMHCELLIKLLDDIDAEVRVAAVETINKLEEGVIGRCVAQLTHIAHIHRSLARSPGGSMQTAPRRRPRLLHRGRLR